MLFAQNIQALYFFKANTVLNKNNHLAKKYYIFLTLGKKVVIKKRIKNFT